MKPPTMDLSLYSDTVTVRVGQKLHLRIPYSGNPTPEFAWVFANSALLQHMKLNQSKLHRCIVRHVNSIPTMQFSLEFPEILSQNLICYHWLSMSGNSKIMHYGLHINMPNRPEILATCLLSSPPSRLLVITPRFWCIFGKRYNLSFWLE